MIKGTLFKILDLCWGMVFLSILLSSCNDYHTNTSHPEVSLSSIKDGEELARKYCQSCHSLPDPSLLDTKTWEKGILPQMGPRLGIFQFGFNLYPSDKNDRYLDKNYYPSQPLLN